MRNKSKKAKRRVGRILASVFGWAIVAVGLLALAFVACAHFGGMFPPEIENLSIFTKVKSNAILSAVASVALSLLGLVVLLSVRLIIKDEKEGLIEERTAYNARQQAIREVGASLNVITSEDDDRAYECDFMPPSCLLEENQSPVGNETCENDEETTSPNVSDATVSESDKTVVQVKSAPKKRKHNRRPNRRK